MYSLYKFISNNHLLVSVLLFLVLFFLVIMGTPTFLFNLDGSIRQFGIGYKNKTIFPIWVLAIALGILSYLYIVYYIKSS
jgi:hypothetical protein